MVVYTQLAVPHTLWPEVTSPAARRALSYCFNCSSADTDRADISAYGKDFDAADVEYARWVRLRLRDSSIAQVLATGPDAIPGLDANTPWWPALSLQISRPRTIEQFTAYLIENLAWVLDPQTKRSTYGISRVVFAILGIVFLSTLCFVIYILSTGGTIGPIPCIVLLSILLGFYIMINTGFRPSMWLNRYGIFRSTYNLNNRLMINATELYWYLRQAFSDTGFPDSELPDPAHPHDI